MFIFRNLMEGLHLISTLSICHFCDILTSKQSSLFQPCDLQETLWEVAVFGSYLNLLARWPELQYGGEQNNYNNTQRHKVGGVFCEMGVSLLRNLKDTACPHGLFYGI